MKNIRLYSALVVVASVLVATACSSDSLTTEPSAAPSFAVGAWSPSLAICKTGNDSSMTKEIGWSGGSLSVNGNTLVIPRYALSSRVTITMRQQKGINSEVELQPEGLRFAIPATLTLDYSDCNVKQSLASIVYLNPAGTYDPLPSVDDPTNLKVTAPLAHFSNYAVAW